MLETNLETIHEPHGSMLRHLCSFISTNIGLLQDSTYVHNRAQRTSVLEDSQQPPDLTYIVRFWIPCLYSS